MTTRRLNLYSTNTAVAAGGTELLASGNVLGDLTDTGYLLQIKAGGNANDTAAGTGAREVTITGLDPTGALISEALATNGALASAATTATFHRVNNIDVTAMGTVLSTPAADINIEDSGAAVNIGSLSSVSGAWNGAHYTPPLGFKAVVNRITMWSNKDAFTAIVKSYKDSVASGIAPFPHAEQELRYPTTGDKIVIDYEEGLALEPLEVIWFKALNSNGAEAIMSCLIEITEYQV